MDLFFYLHRQNIDSSLGPQADNLTHTLFNLIVNLSIQAEDLLTHQHELERHV